MEHALAEMPLAVFTTLAPISAGAFIALAVAFLTTQFSDEQLKKIDKLSFVPLVTLIIGFGAAFLHLTQPMNAINVFAGISRSPMSNEIVVGVIFCVLALIYCIIAAMGKLSGGARKGFAVVVAVGALIFAYFVGAAYMIETILSWNTPLVPLSVIGFCLLGGSLFTTMLLAMAGALDEARATSFKMVMLVLTIIGALAAIGAVAAHFSMVGSLTTLMFNGAALTSEVMMYLVIFIVGALVALACECFALLKGGSAAIPALGLVIVVGAVLMARLVFYALQISVGL